MTPLNDFKPIPGTKSARYINSQGIVISRRQYQNIHLRGGKTEYQFKKEKGVKKPTYTPLKKIKDKNVKNYRLLNINNDSIYYNDETNQIISKRMYRKLEKEPPIPNDDAAPTAIIIPVTPPPLDWSHLAKNYYSAIASHSSVPPEYFPVGKSFAFVSDQAAMEFIRSLKIQKKIDVFSIVPSRGEIQLQIQQAIRNGLFKHRYVPLDKLAAVLRFILFQLINNSTVKKQDIRSESGVITPVPNFSGAIPLIATAFDYYYAFFV